MFFLVGTQHIGFCIKSCGFSAVYSTECSLIGIWKTFSKGLICCYSVEYSTLVYRRVLSGQLSIIGGLFFRVLLNRHLEDVFQGFDLLLFGRTQHIGLSTCFV